MRKGFSLFEVLLAITLIASLFGFALMNFKANNDRQVISQEVKKLKQTLETAKSYALNGKKDASVCGSGPTASPLVGWSVMRVSNTQYQIQGLCEGSTFDSQITNMRAGVQMGAWSSPILFRTGGQGTNFSSDIAITVSGFSIPGTTITVKPNGEIL